MDGLIEIKTNENQEQLVSAKELYKKLGLASSQWRRWYKKNIVDDEYFTEGADYITFDMMSRGNETKDFLLKLDMAKELCMLARTDKGKEIREYFIQVERDWNSPEKVMSRALIIAGNNIKLLQQNVSQLQIENKQKEEQIEIMKPKVNYVDEILKSRNLMSITQIAKDYGMSGKKLNELLAKGKIQYKLGEQWLLYSKWSNYGFTQSETIKIIRKNGNPDIKLQTKWTQKGRYFIYQFLTKNGVYPTVERGDINDMPRL